MEEYQNGDPPTVHRYRNLGTVSNYCDCLCLKRVSLERKKYEIVLAPKHPKTMRDVATVEPRISEDKYT